MRLEGWNFQFHILTSGEEEELRLDDVGHIVINGRSEEDDTIHHKPRKEQEHWSGLPFPSPMHESEK